MINDVFTINGKKYYHIEKSISNSCRGCVFFPHLCSTSTTKLCKHQDLFKTYIFKGIDDLDIIPITII